MIKPALKKSIYKPTVGDAVKEALETGREGVMQGPANTQDITDIKNGISNTNELEKIDKDIDKGIVLSFDETNNSKIEINVKDPSTETSLIEDKILLHKENEEVTVATVTTIPAEDGEEVEILTQVEVPLADRDKDIDCDLIMDSSAKII